MTGSIVLFAVVGSAALVLAYDTSRYAHEAANERASSGVDLLVLVGPDLPVLSPGRVRAGFTAAERVKLDRAVARGRREAVLADLAIWDRTGRLIYADGAPRSRSPTEPDVMNALAGQPITRKHPAEQDRSAPGRRGVLDAFEPLRDENGRVYGAVEVSIPLTPVTAKAGAARNRVFVFVFGGAFLVWLMLLPLAARLSRQVAETWHPRRARLLRAFRRALTDGGVELVYQPQVTPSDGRCRAVEALVRWRDGGELRSPATFLPYVEESDLIVPLTERVLDLALAQLAAWRRDGHELRMSVNISAANLSDPGLPAMVTAALERHEIAGPWLTLELTETAVLVETDVSQRVLGEIVGLGVELSIDDFGTGNSSVSRLHDMPISELKIDRTFVARGDARSRAYVTAIARFAHGLDLRVVAEGVEDEPTLEYLGDLGCELVQGYHICRPIEAARLTAWLGQQRSHPLDDAMVELHDQRVPHASSGRRR